MAAPMVTRRIAEILISNPALNSEQAIAELFSERHSAESPRLRKKVARGRALKNPTTCVQLLQKEEIWEDVDLDLGDGTAD